MNTTEKAIQTDQVPIYDIRFGVNEINRFKSIRIQKKSIKQDKIIIDTEDFIVDSFLNKGNIKKGKKTFNVYVQPPYLKENFITIKDEQIHYNFNSNIEHIKQLFGDEYLYYIALFEKNIMNVIKNKEKYFNIFNKFIFIESFSVGEGFVFFLCWISKIVNESTFSFFFDTVLVLYLNIIKSAGWEKADRYFRMNYIANSVYPELQFVKEDLDKAKIKSTVEITSIDTITEYLCVFVKGMTNRGV